LSGGLVACIGTTSAKADVIAATEVAWWRGAPADPVRIDEVGCICAQGEAKAGIRGNLAIGFHGRIDNMPALGVAWRQHFESELDLIAALYREEGDDFAKDILGDFAIVVLDPERLSLLACRDWIGMRPLFWSEHRGQTAVASEIKQLLPLFGQPLRPAAEPLAAYAASEPIESNATFVHGVSAVPASGHVLATRFAPATAKSRPLRFKANDAEPREASEEIRRLLEIAIIRRMPPGVRAGAMMSGGVDSTAVTGVAASLARAGRSPQLERCYTMALPEIPECDETAQAKQVAEANGLPWQPVTITIADYKAWPDRAFDLHEGPVFPTACGASMIIQAAANDGIDVLLTGLGGDEFADQAGVEFRQALLRGEWRTVREWIRADQPGNVRSVLGVAARAARDYLLKGTRAESKFEDTARRFWTRYTLELIEREGARWGVRVEAPFFDFELASFLAGLAPSVKSTPALSKAALREAVTGLVPDTVRLDPRIIVYNSVIEAVVGPVPAGQTLHRHIGRSYASHWAERADLVLKYDN